MISLTYTEARHILDTLEEVQRDPNAYNDIAEELQDSVTILEACMADYWAAKLKRDIGE